MNYNLVYSKKNKFLNKCKNLIIGRWLFRDTLENKNLNIEYMNGYWTDKKKLSRNFKYFKKIYSKVIRELSTNLNRYHQKQFNPIQWELILYFFVHQYILIAYDRWSLIKSIKKKYKLKPIQLICYNSKNFLCEKTENIRNLVLSHEWNDWILSEIIKEQKIKYYNYKYVRKKIIKKDKDKNIKKFFRFKNINNDIFLKNLELPRYHKVKLSLLLNQSNIFYDNVTLSNLEKNKIKKKRGFRFSKTKDKFVSFILRNLEMVLPKSYIENFSAIESKIEKLNWPKNPKLIVTSYSHYLDDIFKIYTANKISKKTKLALLQHGHQGHHDFCGSFLEKRFCDNYITWGNRSSDKKTIPLFVTTNIGKKVTKRKASGILIKLTEFHLIPWKITHAPRDIESVMKYKDNINFFLQSLNKSIRKITTIKSFDFANLKFVTKHIKHNFKDIEINELKKLTGRGFEEAQNKKLIIETFNSTGFIELLSMNSPVILLTSKPLFHVKKKYKKYYDELIKNEIIFFDPEKAGKFINLNLMKINDWWFEKKRQQSIKYFCNHMCKYDDNINNLSKIFKKIAYK